MSSLIFLILMTLISTLIIWKLRADMRASPSQMSAMKTKISVKIREMRKKHIFD